MFDFFLENNICFNKDGCGGDGDLDLLYDLIILFGDLFFEDTGDLLIMLFLVIT
jgi:hypothetical protein